MPSSNRQTDSDNSTITIDQLHRFAFCARLAYMMHVDGRWMENPYTIEGKQLHSRVDQIDHVLPDVQSDALSSESKASLSSTGEEPPVISRSVSLFSEEIGINGKLDLVSTAADQAVPVETKRSRVPKNPQKSWPPERIQLMAQGLLLRKHGYHCDHGVLYFAGSRTRVDIPFTEELETETLSMIDLAQKQENQSVAPPPLEDSPKCNGCSLAELCLPDETRLLSGSKQELSIYDSSSKSKTVRRFFPGRDHKSPLYVQEQGAYIGKNRKTLTISKAKELITKVRLADTSQVVLCGNISISPQTIHLLCQEEIPLIHLSMGHWFYGCTQGIGLRNAFLREKQFHLAGHSEDMLKIARIFVSGKIDSQRTLLRRNAKEVKKNILDDLRQSRINAEKAESMEKLLGIEGNAARIYFSQFSKMIKSSEIDNKWYFQSRNRRPPKDPVNALLSFGYALLTKETTIALLAEGFDPYWGFYHRPRHGRPALALDLMEEFRAAIVDSSVITAINTGMVKRKDFITTKAGCVMRPESRKEMIRAYEARLDQLITHPVFDYRCSWRRIIRLQTQLLARYVRGEIPEYIAMKTR